MYPLFQNQLDLRKSTFVKTTAGFQDDFSFDFPFKTESKLHFFFNCSPLNDLFEVNLDYETVGSI